MDRKLPNAVWIELVREGRLPVFALLCLGTWLTAADVLMTATIMPSVAADIGGYASFGWAVALFELGAILAAASSGRMSLRYGLRRGLVLGAGVYTLGCLVSALAPEIILFLIGRALQGVGGGWIVGLCFVAVTSLFPERLWPLMLAAISGIWGVATLASPAIGGFFAEIGFWRGAFWFFAMQAIAFGIAISFLIQDKKPVLDEKETRATPFAQFAVLTLSVVAISAAGLVHEIALSVLMGVVGIALLVFFLRLDARASNPLLPSETGKPQTAVGSGLLMIFALSAGGIAFVVYGPAILQIVYDVTPLWAGYILGAEALAWTFAALAVASVPIRYDAFFISLGAFCVFLGIAGFAYAIPHGPLLLVIICALLQGAGFGFMWSFAATRIVSNANEAERSMASSTVPTAQMIGHAAGAAGAGAIANLIGFGGGIDMTLALKGGFWLFAASAPIALLGCVAGLWLSRKRFASA
jgi:MFS family permease